MNHNISNSFIDQVSRGPSSTKTSQVSNIQTHIQSIFGSGYHTFLQGSYKNDTAILDINDVDIVVIRLNTYSGLYSPFAQGNPLVHWNIIFSEIEEKLKHQNLYDWSIERGNKCITVTTSNFKADIVPSVQIDNDYSVDPIAIFSFKDGMEKINYPRTHYNNGVNKNQLTNGNYKFIVRMLKSWAKNYFNDKNIISSYQIESLVYGVENNRFNNNLVLSFIDVSSQIYNKLKQRESIPIKILSVCGYEDITTNWPLEYRKTVVNQLENSIALTVKAYKATDSTIANDLFKKAFNL